MKTKKGSHVGMILSFVIFITFTVFIYTVITPNVDTAESKKTLLNEIGLALIKNMSSEFRSTTVSINTINNPPTNCIKLEGILFNILSANAIIKNAVQNKQDIYFNNVTDHDSLRIDRDNPGDAFFKIYSSIEFEDPPSTEINPCSNVEFGSGYTVGSITTSSYIFEKNMYSLAEHYNLNYDGLKTGLKISPGDEFSFEFTLSNGTKISAVYNLPSQNIYAEDIPVQYIDDNANILSGFINIKVW